MKRHPVAARVNRLEERETVLRQGVVTSASPLEIQIGGNTQTSLSASAVDGVDLGIGDRVAVLVRRGELLVLGRPTDAPSDAGGSDKNYVHTQGSPSAVWTVTHNLGKRPAVSIVDSAGTQWFAQVEYLSDNQCRLTFSGAFSGAAYFN